MSIIVSGKEGRHMSKPGKQRVVTSDRAISYAMSGIDREVGKISTLGVELQDKIGKPGSEFSLCVLRIASLVKGCKDVDETAVYRKVVTATSGYRNKIGNRGLRTVWTRAMKYATPRGLSYE